MGVAAAILAALLFGISTPFAKMLLGAVNRWLLAGLLYLGSGLGLTLYRLFRKAPTPSLPRQEWVWLVLAVVAGGVVAPALLLFGLLGSPASSAALLLNAEGVFTALIAWCVFKENVDRRIALGMVLIVSGALVLTGGGDIQFSGVAPAALILGACLAWAVDNNLTRKVSLVDASWVAAIKGLSAGSVNLVIALLVGVEFPEWSITLGVLVVGSISYGVSFTLFVVALRHLGPARTGAYFSVAPFFGAVVSIVFLDEVVSVELMVAGLFMAVGVWLHLTERHDHLHRHEAMEHEHTHSHDEHHQHDHDHEVAPGVRHTHRPRHQPITHSHPHYPDAHHQHRH